MDFTPHKATSTILMKTTLQIVVTMQVSLLTGELQHGCGHLHLVPGVHGVEVEGGAAAEHLQPPETLQGAALLLLVPVPRPPPRPQRPHTPLLQGV